MKNAPPTPGDLITAMTSDGAIRFTHVVETEFVLTSPYIVYTEAGAWWRGDEGIWWIRGHDGTPDRVAAFRAAQALVGATQPVTAGP